MPSSVRILTRVPLASNATARMSMHAYCPNGPDASRPPEPAGGSGRPQQPLRLAGQPSAVVPVDVVVPGDPQQVQRHVVGCAGRDRLEHALTVSEVTAVLPQEVPDEGVSAMAVARVAHERVLQFACDPPDVEHPVAALHPLQVD